MRSGQAAGAVRLIHEVAGASSGFTVSPDRQAMVIDALGSGRSGSSGRWAEGGIVKAVVVNQSPKNVQELVHEHTEGLHLGERVGLPPLQMGIQLSEVMIMLD